MVLDFGFVVGNGCFEVRERGFVAVGEFGHAGCNLVAGGVVEALDSFENIKAPLLFYEQVLEFFFGEFGILVLDGFV